MKIKWGIIGTGWMAEKFIRDFHLVHNGELYAVASRTTEKAQAFAQKTAIPVAYGTYEELALDPLVQLVYITTPHHLHAENIRLCLEHNKHVICEKPITINATQLQPLIALAKAKQLLLMEAMWTYFLPPFLQVQQWIQAGSIGDIISVKADLGFKPDFDPSMRLFNKETAGGCLLDLGIYGLACACRFIEADVKMIKSSAYIGQSGVDEFTQIHLEFETSQTAQITCSFNTQLTNDAFIIGSKGMIHIPQFFMASKAILINAAGTEEYTDTRNTCGYDYEAIEVNNLILNKQTESAIMPLAQSLKLMKIMDVVRKQIHLSYIYD